MYVQSNETARSEIADEKGESQFGLEKTPQRQTPASESMVFGLPLAYDDEKWQRNATVTERSRRVGLSKGRAMEPRERAEPNDLQNLSLDDLRRAVRIYLELAYFGNEPPPAVRRRLEWAKDLDVENLVSRPPFEKEAKSSAGAIFALRLGNVRYPHMKLQIQPWPNEAGYMLSVNTHDQVLALDPETSDLDAFRELQGENQRLKEQIEQAWDELGLPTFLRYLQQYIQDQKAKANAADSPGKVC
jgi:hypothetical protein